MKTRWIPALVIAAIGLPGWAQSHSQMQGRFPLTAHLVAQTLTDDGVQTADKQVSLLANVIASQPEPVLEILSIEPFSGRSTNRRCDSCSLVKLGCREPGVCLPFYSIVSRLDAPETIIPEARNTGSGTNSRARRQNPAVVIRMGAHATLMMDDARAHVEVAVVSLENGAAGSRIRVATPDHKQVYLAEVVSANLLKRSF